MSDDLTERTLAVRATLDEYPMWNDALCWTVTHTDASQEAVLDAVSHDWQLEPAIDLAASEELGYDGPSDVREHTAWLITTGRHIALFEINGFGGSLRPGLDAVASRVQVLAGMFWNVNGVNQLTIARDGDLATVDVFFDQELDGVGPLIRRWRPAFVGDDTDRFATGLAIVEAETGLALDGRMLAGTWPVVRFTHRIETPKRPPGSLGHLDAELALLFAAATPATRHAARLHAARAAVTATGLIDEAGVGAVIDAFERGRPVDRAEAVGQGLHQLQVRLWQSVEASPFAAGDPADPAFRRLQAGITLEKLVSDDHDGDGFFHASHALGERWRDVRAQLADILRS